jgi:hypothetical protein
LFWLQERTRGGIRSLRKRIVERNALAHAIERSENSWKSYELEHRRPEAQTGAKEGRGLGVGWKETGAWKERVSRDSVAVKGLSCTEEIQLGRHLINPVEALSSVGKKGDFYYCQISGVLKTKELFVVGLIDQRSILSQRKKVRA